jgi:hypothetical protein
LLLVQLHLLLNLVPAQRFAQTTNAGKPAFVTDKVTLKQQVLGSA